MIISARYSNPENTAAIAVTDDRGAVLISQDSPEEWAALHAWGTPEAFVPPPAESRRIAKLTLIDRLDKAGKLAAAFTALGGPGARAYERWQASKTVDTSNGEVLALLTGIGCDPVQFLAPETDSELSA